MKGIDTNILIRFLVQDHQQQAAIVHQLFSETERLKQTLLVTNLVLLETIWVLESVYQVKRSAILDTIDELMTLPILQFNQQPVIRQFLDTARQSKIDLSDALIGHWARERGCTTVLTFDKKAARSELFERLQRA